MEVKRILEYVRNIAKVQKNRKRIVIAVLLFLAAAIFIWPFVFPIRVTGSRLPYEYIIHGTYVEINRYIGNEEEVVIPGTIWFRPVTKIGVTEQWHKSGFDHNETVKRVYIPDSVNEIGFSCFRRCINLEEIHLPAGLKVIGSAAFWRCTSIKGIDIPDKVEEIGESAFARCGNLETITLPDTLKVIGGSAFEDCEKLEYVDIPEGVEEIGGEAFAGTEWEKNFGNGFVLAGKNVLIHYEGQEEIVEVPEGVEYIGYSLFWKCMNMKRLVLPESLKRCSQDLFIFCDNLECVIFKNSDIEFQEDSITRSVGSDVTIVGKKGSAVEAYAERMGCTFQDIGSWNGESE